MRSIESIWWRGRLFTLIWCFVLLGRGPAHKSTVLFHLLCHYSFIASTTNVLLYPDSSKIQFGITWYLWARVCVCVWFVIADFDLSFSVFMFSIVPARFYFVRWGREFALNAATCIAYNAVHSVSASLTSAPFRWLTVNLRFGVPRTSTVPVPTINEYFV